MKTFVRHAVMLMAATVVCQAWIALADEFHWISGGSPSATVVSDEKAPAKEQATSSSPLCGQPSCYSDSCGSYGSCSDRDAALGCDDCPSFGVLAFAGLDSFKGVSDAFLNSNFGAVAGLNAGIPVPGLRDLGVGWQAGVSYGVYDFDGRVFFDKQAESQQQIFVTTGFFRKAEGDQRLSFGMVYDWMINNNWGAFATSPTLGQWRAQVEYALSGSNGVGVSGSWRDRQSQQLVLGLLPVTNRAVNQVSIFWHHKFDAGADSWLYVGVPDDDRLTGDGSLGSWTFGANLQVPLSESLALYANGSYFRPSESAGIGATTDSGYDVGMGLVWYIGGHARSRSINGACWTPYMPLGNNSNFLVDQSVSVP